MTVITGLLAVLVLEFVFGVPVMIEFCLIPAFFLVTVVTGIAEPAGVNIPDRMTIHTPLGSILVFRLQVTGVTGHLLV